MEKAKKLKTVNVLLSLAGAPSEITSFEDSVSGNEAAEKLFTEKYVEIGGDLSYINDVLSEGFFENENHNYDSVTLIHSS